MPFQSLIAAAAADGMAPPLCPDPQAIQDGQRFHTDVVCHRPQYNEYKASLHRGSRQRALNTHDGFASVPNQHTSYCPLDVSAAALPSAQQTGLDTVWIVENKSSRTVVVSYLQPVEHDDDHDDKSAPPVFQEVSAIHPDGAFATPADDPESVLQPGQWMAVHTYEGHVFVVRELDEDTGGSRILLQHTVGMIAVGRHVPPEWLATCPDDGDPAPLQPHTNDIDPHFARTPPTVYRKCHTLDVGFRNVAGCPLNAYYVRSHHDNDHNNACEETFKFHLGLDTVHAVQDEWSSGIKYEGTFVGHAFQFRLAHAPSVWSQLVQLGPTEIRDCPDTGVAIAQAIATNVDVDVTVPIAQQQVELNHHGEWVVPEQQQHIVDAAGKPLSG